ncbi:glycosyltransferase [Luteolibacter pohnpeiensis]|uniref:Glycosyltransferase n=1 Tax=Luteolibacter pohnpeiensis TaxID=454153 RepID=A0A934SBY8_9BACT|nr:glycosyltransferase [Luteolibacter pohnpeiensis]MBK1882483.1 glycosyltransferase [Luteolibacter pohnpeiensis]
MSRKTRVLMVAPTCGVYGGIEAFTSAIASEVVSDSNFEVSVVFRLRPGYTLDERLTTELSSSPFQWRIMGKPDLSFIRSLLWADIVNCHFPLLYATFPARFFRKKLAITIENQRWPEHKDIYLRALMLADARWYISRFVAETWEGNQLSSDSKIVPAVSQLPDEWIDPKLRKGFFFIARWVPKKGIEELVQAYATARIDHSTHPLTLMGAGPLKEEVSILIKNSGVADYIETPGFVDHSEKIQRMAHARWNVAPAAFAEDLGLSPIEARACGVPSIVSDIGGLPEAAGSTALKCLPSDIPSLATALETAANMSSEDYISRCESSKASLADYLPRPGFYIDSFRELMTK